MTTPHDIVTNFYDRLAVGDAPGALALMAPDIEWTTMWKYRVQGRGPERVAEDLFKPLMAEWSNFSFAATQFVAEGDTVVSLGDFTGVYNATGKQANARYSHVWTVRNGKITWFRQYIDTLAIDAALR